MMPMAERRFDFDKFWGLVGNWKTANIVENHEYSLELVIQIQNLIFSEIEKAQAPLEARIKELENTLGHIKNNPHNVTTVLGRIDEVLKTQSPTSALDRIVREKVRAELKEVKVLIDWCAHADGVAIGIQEKAKNFLQKYKQNDPV